MYTAFLLLNIKVFAKKPLKLIGRIWCQESIMFFKLFYFGNLSFLKISFLCIKSVKWYNLILIDIFGYFKHHCLTILEGLTWNIILYFGLSYSNRKGGDTWDLLDVEKIIVGINWV